MKDWTREVLEELRAAAFAPRAWVRFLGRSFARAREQRPAHKRAHRETIALAAGGLAVWLGVALSGRETLGAAGAAWWLAACLMLDWHLGLLDGRDRLGPANVLSLLRAGTVPAIFALASAPAGIALFAVAGASDVLDGRLARRRGETTRLGLWLDGSVDGLVLGAAALAVLPGWATAVVLARYSLPWLVLAAAYFLRAEPPPAERFVSGRYPGLAVFAGLSLALLGLPGGSALAAAGAIGGLATFVASIARSLPAATGTAS